MTGPVVISACIVARNEEGVIRRCLESVRSVADETILVHDGPCEDRTVAIATELGCRVFVRPLVGDPEYQTVFAYEQAHGEWLLSLDADEFLSTEMIAVIPKLIQQTDFAGFAFRWPSWDGERYTSRGAYKPALYRRAQTTLVGHLQSSEQIHGRVGMRQETLHHQPLYNNYTFRSVATKWRRWCRIHAWELVHPFADLPKFNYTGPDEWPRSRRIMNVLSPVLAIPNGFAHFVLTMLRTVRSGGELEVRVAFYQGLYATILQLYVAYYMYVDPLRARAEPRR